MFKRGPLQISAIVFLLMFGLIVRAQEPTPAAQDLGQQPAPAAPTTQEPADPGWPRVFQKDDQRVEVYQPQIDSWQNYKKIEFRMAVAVAPGQDKPTAYGVIETKADTHVDPDTRMVLLENLEAEIRFPSLSDEEASAMRTLVMQAVPRRQSLEVSLDRVMAYMNSPQMEQRGVKVNMDPPHIFYSSKPAILLLFQGQPQFKPIGETGIMFAVNANWDILMDSPTSTYYLLNGDSWLTTADPMKGPWQAADKLPDSFNKLPDDDQWKDVRAKIPGKPAESVPVVFAYDKPAEIIITDGEPQFTPIPGTQLMYVANTQNPVFRDNTDGKLYYMVAGRWFSATSLNGPWDAATQNLPEDFAKIPADSPVAYVLASVPKTPAAEDAVLLASVPHKATVNRKDTTITVAYEGEPVFATIKGTNVKSAINTNDDVFLVNNIYYCCKDGVWFTASDPKGPWSVCTDVPEEIYNIPADFPKHNDTYVYVYDSTPDTVDVGYTGGYLGQYVDDGMLYYGAGVADGYAQASDWYSDWDDAWDRYYPYFWYRPCWSYGRGAVYSPYWGGYYAGCGALVGPYGGAAWAYGPYRGAGRVAYYNPVTGNYFRGAAAYGPAGSARAWAAYNPRTDTAAFHAGGGGIYNSWGRSAVVRDDEWIRGGHRTTPAGTTGWVQTSKGGEAIHTTRGVDKTIAKTSSGDIYAGRDGNAYRKQDDQWQKWYNGGWHDVNPPPKAGQGAGERQGPQTTARGIGQTQPSEAIQRGTGTRLPENRPALEQAAPRTQTGLANAPMHDFASMHSDLNYNYQARQYGNSRANDYYQARSSARPYQSYRPPTSSYNRPSYSGSGYNRPSGGYNRPSSMPRGGGGGGGGGGGRGRR